MGCAMYGRSVHAVYLWSFVVLASLASQPGTSSYSGRTLLNWALSLLPCLVRPGPGASELGTPGVRFVGLSPAAQGSDPEASGIVLGGAKEDFG